MKALLHKWVVVTGAGSGIGRALAIWAGAAGANLALFDRDEKSLEKTKNICTKRASTLVLPYMGDVRSELDMVNFAKVVKSYGGADVIVNNAGVSLSQAAWEINRDDFENLIEINFWGVVRGVELFLPQLREKKEAHIVNVSSLFGLLSMPGQSAYSASKFAVRGYTEALKQELYGSPIHVSLVLPGAVQTNLIRKGKHSRNLRFEKVDGEALQLEFEKLASFTPEKAAARIWKGVLRNEFRILVGRDARVFDFFQRIAPSFYTDVLCMKKALKGRFF